MIVKIGGCNGSGKTSLMRAVLASFNFKAVPWKGDAGKVQKYVAEPKKQKGIGQIDNFFDEIVVLGDYRNVCGGMDTISDKDVRYELVEDYADDWPRNKRKLVLFEGLITGKTFGALGELSKSSAVPWLYVFMDTPFEECVRRVLERRKAKGNDAAFDPERTMRPTFKSCESTARRAKDEGFPVFMVGYKAPPVKSAENLLAKCITIQEGHLAQL